MAIIIIIIISSSSIIYHLYVGYLRLYAGPSGRAV